MAEITHSPGILELDDSELQNLLKSPEYRCLSGGADAHHFNLLLNEGGGAAPGGGNLTSLFSGLSSLLLHNQTGNELASGHDSHYPLPHTLTHGGGGGGEHGSSNSTGFTFCPTDWDNILCWPETMEGQTVTLPCFGELNGIFYDITQNASRYCMEGGNWTKSDYSECRVVNNTGGTGEVGNLAITTGVYFFGYCVSLCALVIAIIIFLAFKELRCLRNTIHTHLMITYVLADTLWIITSSITVVTSGGAGEGGPGLGGHIADSGGGSGGHFGELDEVGMDNQTSGGIMEAVTGGGVVISGGGGGQTNQVPCVTFILLHYFHLTTFFWMFVEGLYLYVLVVKTFVSDNIKLRVYASIGWGIPLTVVIAWSIAKLITHSNGPENQMADPEFTSSTCLWLPVNDYDWIYKTPVILVLAANLIFLLQIMWVLITKLRSALNPETQQSIKAAKALVVLMPLLGITYVLILSGSRAPVYEYLRALLISTQGFLVALLYCFLNGEVRQAVRHRWNRLRIMGPVCCDFERRRQQLQHMTRDWSPRSRTESIRYTCGSQHDLRKRDSITSSEATTVTTINSGFGSAGSGGSGYGHSFFHGGPTASGGGTGSSPPTPPQPSSPTPLQFQQPHQQVPVPLTRGSGWLRGSRGGGGGGGRGRISRYEFQRIKPTEYRIASNGTSHGSKLAYSNGNGTTSKYANGGGGGGVATIAIEQFGLLPVQEGQVQE